ncbi:MAG: sensor histidine kinase, partial [Ruegeria sp.]
GAENPPNSVVQISRTTSVVDPSLKLKAFLKRICRYTCSEGGAIWIRQPIGDQYQCMAQHNRPRLDENGMVSLGDDQLISPKVESGFVSVEFGQEPFGCEWANATRNSDLIERGFKFITAVPIKSDTGIIGSLSLYSKFNKHNSDWGPQMKLVENMLKLMISMYHSTIQHADLYRKGVVHETRNTLPLIDGLVERLSKVAAGQEDSDDVKKIFADYKQHFHQIARYMDSDLHEYEYIKRAIENVNSGNTTRIDAKALIHRCVRPLTPTLRRRGISAGWITGPPPYFEWRANSDDLYHIINNLVGNAVKYSRGEEHNTIYYSLTQGITSDVFTIQNTGIELQPEEEKMMWKLGTRGKDAKRWSRSGEGFGLYYVKEIAKVYGWSARYRWENFNEPSPRQEELRVGWHKFSIVMPKGTIRTARPHAN